MMNASRRSILAAAVSLVFLISGCGGDKEISLDPPKVRYNEDISEMGMFIVDPRYTAAYLPEDGEWILFDDIGEMLKYRTVRYPDKEVRVIWVNDYNDREWLKADEAWYLQSTEINSPMGWGLAAFRDENAARQAQAELGGEVITWDDALNRGWESPPAPVPHGHGSPVAESSPQP